MAFVREEPGEEKLQGRPGPANETELDETQQENLTACHFIDLGNIFFNSLILLL